MSDAMMPAPQKHPFLVALGERVRGLRERRALSRKALAAAAGVSERHLANLEYGLGNVSVLVLWQLSQALDCAVAELLGGTAAGALAAGGHGARSGRVALIGLRGAGKSTLGRRLAADLGCPFVELSREIEQVAGCTVGEIQSLYGASAYRRYERQALEQALQRHAQAVIAVPGGLVSDAASFQLLLAQCTTVWLQAEPHDHLRRVVAQGDLRPMAGNSQALQDLQRILSGRAAFYSKAEFRLDTSAAPLEPTFQALRTLVREALGFDV
jgi:XRE family transcriptional regulator, aerobic/anaerobic benzoate catabolism transcriptional regulator